MSLSNEKLLIDLGESSVPGESARKVFFCSLEDSPCVMCHDRVADVGDSSDIRPSPSMPIAVLSLVGTFREIHRLVIIAALTGSYPGLTYRYRSSGMQFFSLLMTRNKTLHSLNCVSTPVSLLCILKTQAHEHPRTAESGSWRFVAVDILDGNGLENVNI